MKYAQKSVYTGQNETNKQKQEEKSHITGQLQHKNSLHRSKSVYAGQNKIEKKSYYRSTATQKQPTEAQPNEKTKSLHCKYTKCSYSTCL